jgi:hypothetical protein
VDFSLLLRYALHRSLQSTSEVNLRGTQEMDSSGKCAVLGTEVVLNVLMRTELDRPQR